MSQVDTSGRLSLKKAASSDYHLVIHDVRDADSGTYVCSIDNGHEKRHVTVLNVTGIQNSAAFALVNTYFLSSNDFQAFQLSCIYFI